jgi:hypothetical protein
MNSSAEDASPLASFLEKQKSTNSEAQQESVVLHDECGDSMWDEVLAQEEGAEKNDSDNQEATTASGAAI